VRKRVDEVNVVFTVTASMALCERFEKMIFGSSRQQAGGTIRSFHNETDLPLQVGLLVDASNSVRDRFKLNKNRD